MYFIVYCHDTYYNGDTIKHTLIAPAPRYYSVITSESFYHMPHEVVSTQTQTPKITCCYLRKSMIRHGNFPIFNNFYYYKMSAQQQKWITMERLWIVTWLFRYELLNLLILPNSLLLSWLLLLLLLLSLPVGHFIGILSSFHVS